MTSRTELLVSKSATDHDISFKEKGKTKVKSDDQIREDDNIGGRKCHCGCLTCFSLWPTSVSPDVDSNNCPSNETTQEFKPEKRLQNSENTFEHNISLTSLGYPTTEDKKENPYLSYGYLDAQLCTRLFPNNPIWSDGACQDRDLKARDVFHFLSLLSILKYSTLYLASYKFDKGLVWIKVTQAKYKTNAKNNLRCLKLARERPFFTQLISAFKTQHGFYVVSTCQGRCTLDYYLKLQGALKVKDVQFYAVEIVHALVYLHGKEVIHRLSSHNIMLDNTGHLFISDFSFAFFGLSCASQDFENSPNSYKAPEILNGQAYTKAVDWWALGVIVYEMLYCQLPFEGRDLFQSIVSLMTLEPIFKYKNYGSKAIDFCRALLAKSASKRLGSGPDGSYHVLSHTFLLGVDWSNLRWRPAETHLLPAEYTSCCSHPEDCDSLCSADSSVTLAEWQEKRAITKKANKYFKTPDRDLKTDRYPTPRTASKEDAHEPQRVESKTLILHPRNPHRENFISSTLSTLDKVYVLKIQPGEGEPQESPARGPALRTESREKRAGNSSQVNRAERGSVDENASASGTAAEEPILNIFQVRRSKFKGFSIVSKGSVSASEVCTRRNSGEEDERNRTSWCDTARHELCVSIDSDGDDIGPELSNSETGIDKESQAGSGKDGDQRERILRSKIGSGKGNHRGGGSIGGKTISDTFSSARRLDTKPDNQTVIEIIPPAQSHKHPPQSYNETIRADGVAALESDENMRKTITVDNTGKTHCNLSNRRTSTLVNNMDRSNTTSTDGYHNNNSNNGESMQPNKDETSDNEGASQHGPHSMHPPAIKRVVSIREQPSKGEGAFQDEVQCEGPEDIKNGAVEVISSCALPHGVGRLPLGINYVPSATQSFREASGQRCVPNIDVHVKSTETVSSLYDSKPPKNPGLRDNLYQDATTLDTDSYWYGQSDLASCHLSPLVDNLCFGDTPLTNANRDAGSGGVNNETLVDFFLCNGSQSLQLRELVAIGCTNDRVVSEMSTKPADQVSSDHHGQHQGQEPAAEWTHSADAMMRSSPLTPRQQISHQEHDDALQCSNSNVEPPPRARNRIPQNARLAAQAPAVRKASFLGYVTRKLEGNTNERPGPSSRTRDLGSSVSATASTSSTQETLAAHRAFYAYQSTKRRPLSDQHSQGSGSYKVYLNKFESPPPGSSRTRRWEPRDVESKAKAALSSYEQFRIKLSFLNLFKRRNVAKSKGANKKSQLPARLPETLKEVEPRKKKSGFFLLRKRSRTSENDGTRSFTSALHDDDTGPSQGSGTFTGVTRREDSLRYSVTSRDSDSNGTGFTLYYKTVTKQDIKVNSKPTGAAPQSTKFQKRKSTSEDSNSGTRSRRISSAPTTQHHNDTAPNPTVRSHPDPGLSGVNGNQSADETAASPKHVPGSVVLEEHRPGHSLAARNAFSGQDYDCDLMTPELPVSRGQRVMELHGEMKRDLVLENSDGGESMHLNNSSDDGPETNGSGRLEHMKTIEGASMAVLERGSHHTGNDIEDTTNGLGLNIRGHLAEEEAEYNLWKDAQHYWSASKLKFQCHSFNDLDKVHDDAAVDSRTGAARKLQSKSAIDLCQEPLKMLPKCKSVHHLGLMLDGKPRHYCLDKLNLRYPRKSSLKLHLPDEKLYGCDTVSDLQSNLSPANIGHVIRENDLENVPKHLEPTYLVTSLEGVHPSVALHSNEVFNSSVAEPSPDSNMETSLAELYPLMERHSSETFNSSVVEPSLDNNVELGHPNLPSSDTEEKTGTEETSKSIPRTPPEDKSPEQEKAPSAVQRRRQLMSDLDAITPCNDCDVWSRNDRRCARLRQVNYDTSSRYLYGDVPSNDHGQGEGLEVIGTLTIECLVPPVNGLIYRNHVTS